MHQEILDYIEAHRQYGYDLLAELGQIPAPSNHEEKRAQYVCEWFHKNGAPQAFIDEALNVVCPIGVTETNPVTVFMAHLDVVFPDTTPLPLKVHAGSTDCNIPLSLGIPAVCVGVVAGAGAHTREEYVCIDSFVKGYRCAFACILPYFGVKG